MAGRFEVQTSTICGGWENTWATYDALGDAHPQTYDTLEDARADVAEYISEMGQMQAECGASFDPDDELSQLRIIERLPDGTEAEHSSAND
jgi:hypothetical protein